MAANGITVLKHNVPWGPFTRAQVDECIARGDFTLKYLAHAPELKEWLPLGEVLDYVTRREGAVTPSLPPIPESRELPPIPVAPAPPPVASSKPVERVAVPAPVVTPPVMPAPARPAPPPAKSPEPAPVKPLAPPVMPAPEPRPVMELETAPFFLRLIAFFVDCGVIFFPVALLFVLGMLSIHIPALFHKESAQAISEQQGQLWHNVNRLAALLAIGGGWIYAAWYEASSAQATIGKRWMGLKVVDELGERVSFLRATGRYAAKYLSALPCFMGFALAILSSRGLALHDRLAGTRVVRD